MDEQQTQAEIDADVAKINALAAATLHSIRTELVTSENGVVFLATLHRLLFEGTPEKRLPLENVEEMLDLHKQLVLTGFLASRLIDKIYGKN